jgi:hypothetical protein
MAAQPARCFMSSDLPAAAKSKEGKEVVRPIRIFGAMRKTTERFR